MIDNDGDVLIGPLTDPRKGTEKPGRLHKQATTVEDSEALRDDAKEHWRIAARHACPGHNSARVRFTRGLRR
jgi:hypothetical protein